ncbi:MAG TPA: M42 family metallopeptidase [Planctomycetaceae bacterium]|nr:M42 family metallopeptidase [Planctomycetaceae bacterium]
MPDQFLIDLLQTPGTSGSEQNVQKIVREFASGFADEVSTDVLGNVLAVVNPGGSRTILLDAHCDQIGLIVRHIDSQGFVRINAIGGWDLQVLLGQRLVIHTATGPVPGVIARKPIHLLDPDERKNIPKMKDLWIDIGSMSESETRSVVRIGDSVTPEPCLRQLRNDRLSGVAMDDRTGIWLIMTALKKIAGAEPQARIVAVSTVQEEIGLRGAMTSAYNVNPDVAIATDVTHATDCPGIDQNEFGRIEIGKGPVIVRGPNANPAVFELLSSVAQKENIPFQINALGYPASNNAASVQVSRGGCATGIVAIPNRYMHTPVELIAESDLQDAARLVAAFCLAVDDSTSFVPG